MSKKPNKKVSKKDESDDEYEAEDNLDDVDDEQEQEELEDEEDEEEEKDEMALEPETDNMGCNIDDAIQDDDEYFDNNDDTEMPVEKVSEFVNKENRMSLNRLTK